MNSKLDFKIVLLRLKAELYLCVDQGLSQDFETGCPKLAIVFRYNRVSYFSREITIYILITIISMSMYLHIAVTVCKA